MLPLSRALHHKDREQILLRVDPEEGAGHAAPEELALRAQERRDAGLAAAAARHPLDAQTFATIQEGQRFEIENNGGAPLDLVRVLAPPSANGKSPGFAEGVCVASRAGTPIHDVAAEKKRRIYFVGHGAAK